MAKNTPKKYEKIGRMMEWCKKNEDSLEEWVIMKICTRNVGISRIMNVKSKMFVAGMREMSRL